jgi:hypothetical protein
MLHAPEDVFSPTEVNFPPIRNFFRPSSYSQGRNFPTMSEFFPIPILYAGKNPFLADGRDPSLYHEKNAVGGIKTNPLTPEGIIRRM